MADDQVMETRNLWFIKYMSNFWLQDANLLQQVQAQVKSHYTLHIAPLHRRVYVSRGQAMYCNANEEEVALTSAAGFEIYYFEEMNFEQQVWLLHETRVLLAAPAASSTNLLWMQPGTTVVELQNEDAPNLAFFKLAGQCAVDYYCLASGY